MSSWSRVRDSVAAVAGVDAVAIAGRSRVADAARARAVVWACLYGRSVYSMPQLAALTGGRNHATVLAGLRRVRGDLARGDVVTARLFRAGLRALGPVAPRTGGHAAVAMVQVPDDLDVLAGRGVPDGGCEPVVPGCQTGSAAARIVRLMGWPGALLAADGAGAMEDGALRRAALARVLLNLGHRPEAVAGATGQGAAGMLDAIRQMAAGPAGREMASMVASVQACAEAWGDLAARPEPAIEPAPAPVPVPRPAPPPAPPATPKGRITWWQVHEATIREMAAAGAGAIPIFEAITTPEAAARLPAGVRGPTRTASIYDACAKHGVRLDGARAARTAKAVAAMADAHRSAWAQAAEPVLREMAAAGHSVREICAALNGPRWAVVAPFMDGRPRGAITRNMVLGACVRRGIALRARSGDGARVRVVARPARPARPVVRTRAPLSAGPEPAPAATILSVRAGQCRWVHGEPRHDGPVCGAPVVPGKAWCAHHHARAHVSAPATEAA